MPQLGESVAEGTIGKWLKQPGDHVAKYEPLLEVITDKVNAEVPSPYEGVLREILVEEGATVPNNAEIAVIGEVGAAEPGAPAAKPGTAAAAAPAAPTSGAPAASTERTPAPAPADAETPAPGPANPASTVTTPTATAAVPVTATRAAPGIVFPAGADEVLVPMTQMRKGIAAQMTRALQVPHAYVQLEVDVTSLVRLRDRSKKDFQAREGVSLSFVPFVVKASAEALRRNPTFNAHWTENGLLAKRRVNIGIAVAVSDGLIVPVIRDVDGLSIAGINRAIAEVSDRARANKLRIDDFGGGTFTVDNTGWLGTNMVMPIINVPEVGIVTMDRITKRPVVVETPEGDVIAVRSIMNMVLGVDHRANDGAGGAALLRDIKAWLEAVGPDTAILYSWPRGLPIFK